MVTLEGPRRGQALLSQLCKLHSGAWAPGKEGREAPWPSHSGGRAGRPERGFEEKLKAQGLREPKARPREGGEPPAIPGKGGERLARARLWEGHMEAGSFRTWSEDLLS